MQLLCRLWVQPERDKVLADPLGHHVVDLVLLVVQRVVDVEPDDRPGVGAFYWGLGRGELVLQVCAAGRKDAGVRTTAKLKQM